MGLLRARLLTLRVGAAALIALGTAGPPAGPGTAAAAGRPAPPAEGPVEARRAVEVRFLEPSPPALILGDTRLTVEATTSPPRRIVNVRIYVDGALLTILERPPYTLVWDAGTRFRRRVLRAVATDSEGRTGEAVLVARPLYIGQYEEVRLVNVFATVRDRRGRVVLDLKEEDFRLVEDGVPQTITHFSSARVPLTVALLIDASNSMNLGGKIAFARKAAEAFVESAGPDDRLMVVAFNDEVRELVGATSEAPRLKEAIASIRAEGGTALYDAIYRIADRMAAAEGRRAIVLLSDGRDQALAEDEPGSLHLFEEALEKAHRAEVAIYSVGLGRHLDAEMDVPRLRSLKEILETFARQTGGRAYFPSRPGRLSRIYRQIAADLKAQYSLAYTSANRARDGRWRSISVEVKDPDLTVQARAGYYAPGPGAP
ncbi:MAG: VWA domain-containing protein [Acidobacteriota bacterium]